MPPQHPPVIADEAANNPPNLWKTAYDSMDEERRNQFNFIHDDDCVDPKAILEIVAQKKASWRDKQSTLYKKKSGEKVKLSDILDKVSLWIKRFIKIGDTAVQFDSSGHAAIPWLAVKSILQLSVKSFDAFGSMVEGVEKVSRIIALFPGPVVAMDGSRAAQLSASLLKLYSAVLTFLADAHAYFSGNPAKRIWDGLKSIAKDDPIQYIEELEIAVCRLEDLSVHEYEIRMLKDLDERTERIDERTERMETQTESTNQRTERIEMQVSRIDRDRILSFIDGIRTKQTYETALGDRLKGTCRWVLQLENLHAWQFGDPTRPKLLWIHGPPGFGKTIMSASITEHLKETTGNLVAYFFCVADNHPSRDPYAILRSWLLQALETSDEIFTAMHSRYKDRVQGDVLTHAELWNLFVAVGSSFSGCIFVVDGFDECIGIDSAATYHAQDPRNYFFRDLMQHLPQTRSRILVVSRDVADIREYLGQKLADAAALDMFEYGITADNTAADIKSFSEALVNQKLPKKPTEVQRKIALKAAERSDGMFLWVKLLEKQLSPGKNVQQLEDIVSNMPSGLDKTYVRELEAIAQLDEPDREKALMVLQWVLFAWRPLAVKELVEALAVSDDNLEAYPHDQLPDGWDVGFVNEDEVNAIILNHCGSLLQLHASSSGSPLASHTVRLVHFSLKEYLMDSTPKPLKFAEGIAEEARLSKICLRYLLFTEFNQVPRTIELYPFMAYAAWAWYWHSFHGRPTPIPVIMEQGQKLFEGATLNSRLWALAAFPLPPMLIGLDGVIGAKTTSLWQMAFNFLDDRCKDQLNFVLDLEPFDVELMLKTVARKKQSCHLKGWTSYQRKNGDDIKLSDILDQISLWIKRFTQIGYKVAQFPSSSHAAIPWSGVKFLLQIEMQEFDAFGAMAESVERISRIITLFSEPTIDIEPSRAIQLSASLLELYSGVLTFLADAHASFSNNPASQLTSITIWYASANGIEAPFWSCMKHAGNDDAMKQIEELADAVCKLENLSVHEYEIRMLKGLNEPTEGIDERTERLDERMERLDERTELMDERTERIETQTGRIDRDRILSCIDGIRTAETYHTALRNRHPGTCEWVLQLQELHDWQSGNSPRPKLLWIHGPPGFGKTVLSASITQHLKKTTEEAVAYFFCAIGNQPTRNPYAILRSWLAQALETPKILIAMQSRFDARTRANVLSPAELWDLFVAIGSSFPGCIFVVNGFDECTDGQRSYFLRDLIHHLSQTRSRVLVVSRAAPDIREYLDQGQAEAPEVEMTTYGITAADTAADVRSFVEAMVLMKFPKMPAKLRQEISMQVAQRSDGMFLWVTSLVREISLDQNAEEVVATMHEMPATIYGVYTRELENIAQLSKRNRQRAAIALQLVSSAVRPLEVGELIEAIVVSANDLEEYPHDSDFPDGWKDGFVSAEGERLILGCCGPLLQLRSGSSHAMLASRTVHLAHFSLKDYLLTLGEHSLAKLLKLEELQEASLSKICLKYLALDVFNEIPKNIRRYPFLAYAAWAWYFHSFYGNATPQPDLMNQARTLFDPSTPSSRVWALAVFPPQHHLQIQRLKLLKS